MSNKSDETLSSFTTETCADMLRLLTFPSIMTDLDVAAVTGLIVFAEPETEVNVFVKEDTIDILFVPNKGRIDGLFEQTKLSNAVLTHNDVLCKGVYRFVIKRVYSNPVLVEEKQTLTSPDVIPFIFGRLTDESQLVVNEGGKEVIKDWAVSIALHDLKIYNCAWMVEKEYGNYCLIPALDVQIEPDHIFATFEQARAFVKEWWKKN